MPLLRALLAKTFSFRSVLYYAPECNYFLSTTRWLGVSVRYAERNACCARENGDRGPEHTHPGLLGGCFVLVTECKWAGCWNRKHLVMGSVRATRLSAMPRIAAEFELKNAEKCYSGCKLSNYQNKLQNANYRQSRPTKIWENEFMRCLSQCYSAWWCCSRRAAVVELGFVFLFVVSCFRFSVRISGWFLNFSLCALFSLGLPNLGCKKNCADFAEFDKF